MDCEKLEAGVGVNDAPNGNLGSYEAVDSELIVASNHSRQNFKYCPCFQTLQYLRRSSDSDQDHENCHLAPCRNIKTRKSNKERK